MHQAGIKRAGALVVVARILVKERGEHRVSEEVTGASVDKLCRKTFAVSRGTLPVPGIGIIRLLEAGSESDSNHRNRIECAACSEREFLFPGECRSIINVARIEIWEDADQALLLCGPYLLRGDQVGGTDHHFHAGRRNR